MLKNLLERFLLLSRWLLAPLFVMLIFGLLALIYKAGKRLYGMFALIGGADDRRITLELLNLVDITLTGALVVIVTVSIYENFISPVRSAEPGSWPDWMGHIDFSQLKHKLLTTIVAISAIKLLEAFEDVPEENDRELFFYMAIHLTFVVSTLAFAIGERFIDARDKARA